MVPTNLIIKVAGKRSLLDANSPSPLLHIEQRASAAAAEKVGPGEDSLHPRPSSPTPGEIPLRVFSFPRVRPNEPTPTHPQPLTGCPSALLHEHNRRITGFNLPSDKIARFSSRPTRINRRDGETAILARPGRDRARQELIRFFFFFFSPRCVAPFIHSLANPRRTDTALFSDARAFRLFSVVKKK